MVDSGGDVRDEDTLAKAYEATVTRFGPVNVVINNAALLQHHLFRPTGRVTVLDTSAADWEQMLGVNVIGVVNVLRHFARPMLEHKSGSIINISSSSSVPEFLRPSSMEQPYMASKAAESNLTLYLADELREHNIAVNVVFAGHSEMTGYESVDDARRTAKFPTPPSRSIPEHIVPLLAFLATRDVSNGPTGQYFNTPLWNIAHGLGPTTGWLRDNVRDPVEYEISKIGRGVEFEPSA